MTDRAKKFAATLWALENPRKAPVDHYIRVADQDNISIAYRLAAGEWFGEVVLSRRKARLLAKRINQMLDETK